MYLNLRIKIKLTDIFIRQDKQSIFKEDKGLNVTNSNDSFD